MSNQNGGQVENSTYVKVHTADIEGVDTKSLLKKQNNSSKIYKQYPYRWVVMALFFLSIFLNGIAYETCIPNTIQFTQLYGVSDQVITATATIYMLMHPLFTFAASSVIVNKGFAFSVKLGCVFTIFGFALRLLMNSTSFYFVLVGQVFTGMGRPFIMNSQATMSQNWFFPSNRTAVLTASNTVQTLSIVASLLMPTNIFFKQYEYTGTDDNIKQGKRIASNLMYVQFFMSLFLLPVLFLLKSNPPNPPSGFANSDKDITFGQAVKKLFLNKNFNIIFIAFSVYFGTLKGFGLIIPYLMKPYGFVDSQFSMTGSMTIIGGLLSSGFISKIVLYFKSYKRISLVLMVCSMTTGLFLYICLKTEKIVFVYSDSFIIGFFLVPLAPVLLEYSCEAIYPINGSFAVGVLISGATLFTVISSQILTAVVKGKDSDNESVLLTIILMIGLLFFGFVLQLFSKEILNRSKEVQARSVLQKSMYFKSKVLKESVHTSQFKNKEDITQAVGDYPTEHPFVDNHQFIVNPEVFNPDVVQELEDDDAEDDKKRF